MLWGRVLAVLLGVSVSLYALAAPVDQDEAELSVTIEQAGHGPAEIRHGLADRDGDGLSDALQAKLAESAPGEIFDVVVTFSLPGRAADKAQRAVGPFQIRDEFQIIRGFSASMTAAQAMALSHGTAGRCAARTARHPGGGTA